MRIPRRYAWVASLASVLAVGSTCNKPEPIARPLENPEPQAEIEAEAPWPGRPHAGGLRAVAVDHAGKAVVSVDDAGEARLWTKLDGSRLPLPIPLPVDPKAEPQLDVIVDDEGWRALSVSEAKTTLVEIDGTGSAQVQAEMRGVTAALLLPGGDTLRAAGGTVSVLHADGSSGKPIPVPEPVVTLLPTPSRKAVVAVSGQMQETEVVELWSGGAHVEVFVGTLTGIAIGKDGKLARRGDPIPFTSSSRPDPWSYAVSDNGRHVAFPEYLYLDEAETDTMLDGHYVAIELETGRRTAHEYWGNWVAFNADNQLEWEGKEGQSVTPPLLDELRRAAYGAGVWARPDGPWLRLASDEYDRWLGNASFQPHAVAFSPDGKRMVWAENQGDYYEKSVLRFGAPGDDALSEPMVLDELGWAAGMAWHAPDAILLADLEGQLFLLDPDRGSVELVDKVDQPIAHVQHDPRSGVTLVVSEDELDYLVPWRAGRPGGALGLGRLYDHDVTYFGFLPGSEGGVWAVLDKGMVFVGVDDIRADTLTLTPETLSRDAREVFDVTMGREGERIIDWGDEWEISGSKPATWQRDTPVFGPLLPAPNGQALLTLPECGDKPWKMVVHPKPAADLGPGDSFTQEIPRYADVQWSPDGRTIAIAAASEGGMLFDIETRSVTRRWRAGEFAMRDEVPPEGASALGRCRSIHELEYEHYYE